MALSFEQIHEETYRDFGNELVFIEPGSVLERAEWIMALLGSWRRTARIVFLD